VDTCEERNEIDVRGSVHHSTIHTEKFNNRLVCRFGWDCSRSLIQTCTPNGHLHRV